MALGQFAQGKSNAMVEIENEASAQQAAEILKVSRRMPRSSSTKERSRARRVGRHRRALTSDVLAYKQRETEARLAVLDELAAEGQQLKLGY